MLEWLMFALWGCLGFYATWYFTSAKHYAPVTLKEARILWKIHKLDIRCNARKWREIKRGGKLIGFECECGYKHIQKRPIVANMPKSDDKSQNSELPTFNQMHALYRSE